LRVTILNTCSALNPGDAAILISQVQMLKRCAAQRTLSLNISIASRTPEYDSKRYRALGIDVMAPLVASPGTFRGRCEKIFKPLTALLDVSGKRRLLEAIKQSRFVVASGGGYLYSNNGRVPGPTFLQQYVHLAVALRMGRPLVFFPQSFGPIANAPARRLVRKVLTHPRTVAICPREDISEAFVRELIGTDDCGKVALCPDVCFQFEPDGAAVAEAEAVAELPRPVVGVTLREWMFPRAESGAARMRLRENFMRTLAAVARRVTGQLGGSVIVIPQVWGPGADEDDRLISDEFIARLRGADADAGARLRLVSSAEVLSPSALVGIISQLDALIGCRFHSCIFAFLAGTPAICIGYQHKSEGTMQMLGLGRYWLEMSDVDERELGGLLQDLLDNGPRVRSEIGNAVERARRTIDEVLGGTISRLLGQSA